MWLLLGKYRLLRIWEKDTMRVDVFEHCSNFLQFHEETKLVSDVSFFEVVF